MVGLLKQFPQYTLATLRAESDDLLRYVNIINYGREVSTDGE